MKKLRQIFKKDIENGTFVIPEDIEILPAYCFWNCNTLFEITIPDTVKLIEPFAFAGCEKLRKIKIPDHIPELHWQHFELCHSLEEIKWDGKVFDYHDLRRYDVLTKDMF